VKRTAFKGREKEQKTAKARTVRRTSRVQRGRVTLRPRETDDASFARWTTSYPWDGRHSGAGLVDNSQLACECGECWGCQSRVG
jgi:hypothetical protein